MASVDGSRSLQGASDEVHTNICGPCKNDDVERGANHYCQDCPEYLCDHCKDHHRKLRLTKNHRIVSGSQVPAVSSIRGRPSIVVYCSCNRKQEVQYFCEDHKNTVCDLCKSSKHYKCKVSGIQDKSSAYFQTKISSVMSELDAIQDEYAKLKQARDDDIKSLERSTESCRNEIATFRKEINTFLDDLEKNMLKQLASYEKDKQSRISQQSSTLTATLKMLETDYKLLHDAKNEGRKATMFAADVQVSKGLQEYSDRLSDIRNDAINTDIQFEKNAKLARLQTEIDSLGSLISSSSRNAQRDRKMLLDSKIQSQKKVNVKLPDDGSTPRITGLAVMTTGEIVLCDPDNYKLKLVDNSDVLQDSLKLNAAPWNISIVDSKTVIVTLPGAKQLQYIEVFPRLTPGRVLQLDKYCYGVQVTGDKIFTSCHNNPGKGEVRILDLDRNLLQQLGINKDGSFLFTSPYCITVSPTENKIFVSDTGGSSVTCMTMNNDIVYKYSDNEMKWPRGIYCDVGDNILVSGLDSNNVQVITADGKKHCDLVSSREGLTPLSISYRERDDTLIVGCLNSDNISLFKLVK